MLTHAVSSGTFDSFSALSRINRRCSSHSNRFSVHMYFIYLHFTISITIIQSAIVILCLAVKFLLGTL